MWPCSSLIIKALSGISHTNICTLTIALYKRTDSRHHSTPDIVNNVQKKTSLYTPLFSKRQGEYISHGRLMLHTHVHLTNRMWSLHCGVRTEKDRKVETRNLTQGIHVLLFLYLVVDLNGFIENAQLRQHYATFEPKIGLDKFCCFLRWRQNYKSWSRQVW